MRISGVIPILIILLVLLLGCGKGENGGEPSYLPQPPVYIDSEVTPNGIVRLKWTKVADADHYNLYWYVESENDTDETIHWDRIYDIGDTSFILYTKDHGVHHLMVSSKNSHGESKGRETIFTIIDEPCTLLSDDFIGDIVNTDLWELSGNEVSQNDGILGVYCSEENNGGVLTSKAFSVNPRRHLNIERDVRIHYANDFFDGHFNISIEGKPDYS